MPLVIAPLVAALGAAFRWVIATGVGMLLVQLVAAIGIGFVVYSGVDLTIDWFVDRVKTELTGAGEIAQMLGLLGIDVGISIVTSAFAVSLTLQTVGGVMKRFAMKG